MRNGTLLAVALMAVLTAACGDEQDEPAGDPGAGGAPAVELTMAPMPPSGFRVEWGMPGVPSPVSPGASFAVGVTVKNTGDQLWLDPRNADSKIYAAGAVRLTYRWWGNDAKKAYTDYATAPRGDLHAPINPGQTAVMAVPVTAPTEPGRYELQLELVQENVSWFEEMGAATLRVPVLVKAAAAPKAP